MQYPVTPDRRYFVVRGRLWRMSNPELDSERRQQLVAELMSARRAVKAANGSEEKEALRAARKDVNLAKIGHGDRGRPWWTDSAPDLNRHLAATRLTRLVRVAWPIT